MPNSDTIVQSKFTILANRANQIGLDLIKAMKAHAGVVYQTPMLIPIKNSDGQTVYQQPEITPEMQAQFDNYAKQIADLTKEAKACNEALEAEVQQAKNQGYTPEWVYRSRKGWVRSDEK